ncbi:MAG: hypothetical protein H6598_01795 [Flavobacteriales bacterium]|nr:hypothetical protein [Flavobacteriales bacterium]
MKKISTLFKKDPKHLGRVINEVCTQNLWILEGLAIATRKFDGTSCAIIAGELYKRFDLKKGRVLPDFAIPCRVPDPITGHHPHWVKCDRSSPSDQWHFAAFNALADKKDGTYELCGEKIQGNPEGIKGHQLIPHGKEKLEDLDLSFEGLKRFLTTTDIEGIVFHHLTEDKLCKIRKSDFGIKR